MTKGRKEGRKKERKRERGQPMPKQCGNATAETREICSGFTA